MLRTRSVGAALILYICALVPALLASEAATPNTLDRDLAAVLSTAGFTGTIQQTYQARIEANLGRPIDARLAEIGRMLWFDTIHSLHADNTCGGCHSPTNGFGDSQPMAIGVQNNGLVGPHRTGPRNQRRSPLVINTALYPALMWNGRFSSLSGDPFDNSRGFRFPFPEGDERFSHANDVSHGLTHLLQAQAHMPPTELIEVAGFTGTCAGGVPDTTLGPAFCQFDDGLGRVGACARSVDGFPQRTNPPEGPRSAERLAGLPPTVRRRVPRSRRREHRSTSSCSGRRLPNSSSPWCSRMRRSTSSRGATRRPCRPARSAERCSSSAARDA